MLRHITVFVRDRYNNPLPGAQVEFYLDDKYAGEVLQENSEGRGSIEVPRDKVVSFKAAYKNHKYGPRKFSQDASTRTIIFPVRGDYSPMRSILPGLALVLIGIAVLTGLIYLGILAGIVPLVVGLVLLGVSVALAFSFREPSLLQQQMIRSILALGLGALASAVPGILSVSMNAGTQAAITAGGAIAVWLITFFFVPARDKDT